MKRAILSALWALSFSLSIYAACPLMPCPASAETPSAEYLFEGNLQDTSGHGLDGIEFNPSSPVTYYAGIGGRPGLCAGNFTYNSYTGAMLPSCMLFNDQGEIEWYQYVTNPANSRPDYFFLWISDTGSTGIFPGDGGINGSTFFRLSYSCWIGGGIAAEEYMGEWLKFNQWQHCSFQWGSFGTRLIIDDEIVAGSFNQWYQGLRNQEYIVIGTWLGSDTGFDGYIDDLRFWPCAGHGMPTATPPPPAWTSTFTMTPTPVITPSFTGTVTHTLTGTSTQTCTATETAAISATSTKSPEPTPSYTATLTASITPTATVTPAQSGNRLFGAFPNPAKGAVRIIFSAAEACAAGLSVYTAAGETAGETSMNAKAGLNVLVFRLKNPSGVALSSGVYLYRLELKRSGKKLSESFGKFSAVK